MAHNQGVDDSNPMQGADATPIINGYKMLKQTPLHASQQVSDHADSINARFFRSSRPNLTEQGSSRFKMPISAHREQLGHQIANEAQIRKREQKAQEKFRHYSKLGLAMQAQESVGNKAASEVLCCLGKSSSISITTPIALD